MKHTVFHKILCLALALCAVLSLCACPGSLPPEPDGPGNDTPGGGGGEETPPSEGKPVPKVYADATPVSGGGATLALGAFALTAPIYDESTADTVRAKAFFSTTEKGTGKVFRVVENTLSITTEGVYDGEGAVLLAPGGLQIVGATGVTLKNLTVVGSISVVGSTGVTLERVAVLSEGTALSADGASGALAVNNCRLVGKTALALAADESAILNSYLGFTETGVADTATAGTTVRNCVLEGSGTGIASSASDSAFRANTLKMGASDTGICLAGDILNALVALNVITGAQRSIAVTGAENVSLVLNTAVSIEADGNQNLYICDNNLGGRLTVRGNNYFIADGNQTPNDEWNHETVQSENKNQNGNNLIDESVRPEVGADESLLPHVNKDLFVGMARKKTVKDVADSVTRNITDYIEAHAKTDDYIIIAPGAYRTNRELVLFATHSNTKVYAYGVYLEREGSIGNVLTLRGAESVSFKGLTIGYSGQSCGQVYVLEKMGSNQIRVITGAGMENEFGLTKKDAYQTNSMGAQRMGTTYAYCDTWFEDIKKEKTTVTLADGSAATVDTMVMTLYRSVYDMLAVGDILTCRLGDGPHTVVTLASRDVVFYDVTLYGNAAGIAFIEENNYTATTYYRVCDTTRSGEIIDKEAYEAYAALGEKYKVDLQVSIDDKGRYRGSLAQIGSLDATHATNCAEGSRATFCLFENMADDATNQNHTAARLHSVEENEDGTLTLTYKGVLANHWVRYGRFTPDVLCTDFKAGDRVYIYTANGQLICDTRALSETLYLPFIETNDYGTTERVPMRSITVPGDAISEKAKEVLKGYDLSLNTVDDDKKVLVDNMSMASNGFRFDNCLFRNIRSRGLLVKSSEGVIQNCTFRNIGCACAAILYEIFWGESGVTENMLIDRNLIENTGFFAPSNYQDDAQYETIIDTYSPISIQGLGSSVDEDFLLYRNIVISNNKIVNRAVRYAVYINSAKDVKLIGNDFGTFAGNDFTKKPEAPESESNPVPVIHIHGAMNIEISGNVFPPTGLIPDQVVAEKNKNVFGTDVIYKGMILVPDSE